jgi:hypothetical protein
MNHTYIALTLFATLTSFGQVPYQLTEDEKEQVELVERKKSGKIDPESFFNRATSSKIVFYGQVFDQDGMPVGGADVIYSTTSNYRQALGATNTKRKLTTGDDGFFSIKTNGIELFVSIEKTGYRRSMVRRLNPDEGLKAGERVGSSVLAQYFDMSGNPQRNHHPEEKRPVQFTIRKIGKLEQLKHVTGCFWVKSNGTPRSLSLEAKGSSIHCIEVICRSEYDRPVNSVGAPRRYDWSFEIRVEKGGVQEIKDDGFEAPLDGYRPSLLVAAMSADDPRWVDEIHGVKSYYVRFEDDVCARIKIVGGGTSLKGQIDDPYIYLESWLNPDPKSRNLETLPIGR